VAIIERTCCCLDSEITFFSPSHNNLAICVFPTKINYTLPCNYSNKKYYNVFIIKISTERGNKLTTEPIVTLHEEQVSPSGNSSYLYSAETPTVLAEFFVFFSVLPGECRDRTPNLTATASFHIVPHVLINIILSFDTMPYSLSYVLSESLNKPRINKIHCARIVYIFKHDGITCRATPRVSC
jgi:hypothetical protein